MIIDLTKLSDGFSSRLKVISYFLAIIHLKKLKRILYIYEKKTKECPFLFTDLFKIRNYKIIKLKKKPKTCFLFNSFSHSSTLDKLKTNFNIIEKNKNFKQVSQSLYKNYLPKKKIKDKIKKIKLPKKFISIHLRGTDRIITLKNFIINIQFKEMMFDFQINHMMDNFNTFLKKKTHINNIFICSDDKSLKEKITNQLSKKFNIFYNNTKFKIQKFRQTNGVDFITELFCLSKSQFIISTMGGAVPLSAKLISKKKIKIYKWIDQFNIYFICNIIINIIFYLKILKNRLVKNVLKKKL